MKIKSDILKDLATKSGAVNYGSSIFLHGQPSDIFVDKLINEVLKEVVLIISQNKEKTPGELIIRDMVCEELENHFKQMGN